MRPIPAILGALTAIAIFFFWPSAKQTDSTPEEIVKPATMVSARIAGTTSAIALDYKWKRQGPDAVADLVVENLNKFEVTSFDFVCYLFDKDAKSVGEAKHAVQTKVASNAKSSFAGILFRNVEPNARQAICQIENAKPWVQF